MKSKLKPCPFCGSNNTQLVVYTDEDLVKYYVQCFNCNARGSIAENTKDKLFDLCRANILWNRRTK